jgi:hypothetical protein
MAITPFKTWISGEVLTASDLNSSFSHITSNAASLISPLTAALDMNGLELILDVDGDTSITADSDDIIHFKLQGIDLFIMNGATATAVNGLTFLASATGSAVQVQAQGSDTDISINLVPKGSGIVQAGGTALLTGGASNTMTSTDAGAAIGPAFILDRNSATPAANDVIGGLQFKGRDSGAGTDTYAQIHAEIDDPTAASEDGAVSIHTALAGTLAERLRISDAITAKRALNLAEGADVASAATCDIWAKDGNTIHVTGSTGPITSFGTAPQAGAWRFVIFDSTPTITHGSNLALPGGENIVAAAGDIAFVYADTTTQFDVLYFPVSGRSVIENQPANLLINGAFRINQRAPATNADDTYAHDRWYVLTQTSTIAVSTLTDVEDGTPCMARLTQSQASAQRMGYAQIIEGKNCKHLRGSKVAFRFRRMRISASQAVRYAILEWTGTEDSVTSDVVNDWTSSTYTAGNFFLGSNLTVSGVTSHTPSAATLTDGPILTVTLGSSFNNLIVMVWTEGTAAQNVTLDLAKAKLTQGIDPGEFRPESYSVELARCQRYFWRSQYGTGFPAIAGYNSTGGGEYISIQFPVEMRTTPTALVSGTWNTSNNGGVSVAFGSVNGLSLLLTISATGTYFAIPNSSDDYLQADAEL